MVRPRASRTTVRGRRDDGDAHRRDRPLLRRVERPRRRGVRGCFAPDGVREWRVLAPPHIGGSPFPRFAGRAAIADRIAQFMASVPDLELEVSALSEGSDDRVWTE